MIKNKLEAHNTMELRITGAFSMKKVLLKFQWPTKVLISEGHFTRLYEADSISHIFVPQRLVTEENKY